MEKGKCTNLHKKFIPVQIKEKNEEDTKENVEEKIIFKIFYSKQIQKKHKCFSDGFLLLNKNNIKIINEEGKQIFNGFKPKGISSWLEGGETFIIGANFGFYICYVFFLI